MRLPELEEFRRSHSRRATPFPPNLAFLNPNLGSRLLVEQPEPVVGRFVLQAVLPTKPRFVKNEPKTKHKIDRNIADRQSIDRPPRPSGVQQRGLKKAAERPSAGSQKTAGRSSAGSVTAAAERKA